MTSGEGRSPSVQTVVTDYSLPALSSATSHKVKVSREYKSGACYEGDVKDNQRCGLGVFAWPNGAKYEGEFIDNDRHGKGMQVWPDGSCYEGDFINNMRHGHGNHTWANGETYVGRFFRDRRHGSGTYTWPDGSKYVGTFYMDKKEGYGKFFFSNGDVFEGLYGSDERYGPGVVTYPDTTADVGLWHREKLVRMSAICPKAFTIKDHPEVEFYPEEHARFIDASAVRNRTDLVDHIVHPPEQFNYPPGSDIEDMALKEIFSDTLHRGSLAVDIQIFDEEFFKDVRNKETIPEENVMVKAWNNTPSSLAMQSHILRHESRRHTVSFNVQEILDGDRSNFPEKGKIEKASEEFLVAAQRGDGDTVAEMLNTDLVYVDVSDMKGHTALLGAAVNWHQDVINTLLDNGSDVNRTNNECVSPLAACHIYFYPVECFKYNIAERYLKQPKDFQSEACYDVNDAVKTLIPTSPTKKRLVSIVSTAEKKSLQPTPPNNINTKKIHKLRQEYKSPNLDSIKEAGKRDKDSESQSVVPEEDKENTGEDGDDEEEGEEEGEEEEAELRMEEEELFNDIEDPLEPRTLGTLQVRRVTKTNIEDMLVKHPRMNVDIMRRMNRKNSADSFDAYSETEMSEFESIKSVRNLPIDVSDGLIERCATQLSQNDLVVGRRRAQGARVENMGTARRLAVDKKHQDLMQSTIQLLLNRGSDPNASSVPMPVLFYAIKAADVTAVRLLLMKGASTATTLSEKKGGLCPLHIAAAIPGEEGIAITELLLNALGNPDARSALDDTFLNRGLEEEWSKDVIHPNLKAISGGRTPLHIACARDDNYKNACRVVHLLLAHHGNPNLLCNGNSPLALAVSSGNDLAIDELLSYGADPCLPLTHGVGSALCIASNTEYEHRRSPPARIYLIDKLIRSGADILAPILIGPKRVMGTAVDYAYYMYNLDRRIAHMPYHALTPAERETYNARRRLLAHMGDVLRHKAVERERRRLEEEDRQGRQSLCPSPNFTYTGAGAPLPPGIIKGRSQKGASATEGRVSFGGALTAVQAAVDNTDSEIRKPLFRYCYECGRSVGVRLSACTRCKEVYYCSKACKLKAWNARHKDECVRVGGRSCSPSPNRGGTRIDSPTPATDPELGAPTTVAGIAGNNIANRLKDKERRKRLKGTKTDDSDRDPDDGGKDRRKSKNKNKRQSRARTKTKTKSKKKHKSKDDQDSDPGGKSSVDSSDDEQKKGKPQNTKIGDTGLLKKKSNIPDDYILPDSTDSDSDSNNKKEESIKSAESNDDSESDNSGKDQKNKKSTRKGAKPTGRKGKAPIENVEDKPTKGRWDLTDSDEDDRKTKNKKSLKNAKSKSNNQDFSMAPLNNDKHKESKNFKTRKKAWEERASDSEPDLKGKNGTYENIEGKQKKHSGKEKRTTAEQVNNKDESKNLSEKKSKKTKKKLKSDYDSYDEEESDKPKSSKGNRVKEKKKPKAESMKLKLDWDRSDDEFGSGLPRPSYDQEKQTKKPRPPKKKKERNLDEADWMSPRKHQKPKPSRFDDDWFELGDRKPKVKKDKVKKDRLKNGEVSMLHPKLPKSKTTLDDATLLKVHSKKKKALPPIAESPSGATSHYSQMPPSMRVTMASISLSQRSRNHDNGALPSPTMLASRSRTHPGTDGLKKENIRVKMRINVKAKNTLGRDAGVADHVVPYSMAAAAISKMTSTMKVGNKSRSRSAVVRGPKGRQKDGLLPRLANKANTFHGLTTPQYALSILPGLQGIQDLQRFKHIYVDNYSFN